jgi:peptidoglycan-associated lipoprotein
MPNKRCFLPVLFSALLICSSHLYAIEDVPEDAAVLKNPKEFFGKVMAGHDEKILLGAPDLLITNFGSSKSGEVTLGKKFRIYERNTNVKKDDQGRYIYRKIGEIVLTKVFEEKSLAKITHSSKELILDPDQTYYLDEIPAPKPEVTPPPAAALAPPAPSAPELPPVKETEELSPAEQFEKELIYFAFDDAGLTADSQEILKSKASFLLANSDKKVLIEGHCDERGSVEYNLALGQRRATSARNFLIHLGVEASRLRTISYGKERPVDPGHNEEAWAKNRRDQFVLE